MLLLVIKIVVFYQLKRFANPSTLEFLLTQLNVALLMAKWFVAENQQMVFCAELFHSAGVIGSFYI